MGTKDRPSKTITRLIRRPSLEIGSEIFPAEQIKEARISFRIEEHIEYRSASVTLNPPATSRWNYHSEVKLYEEKGVILTGLCSEAIVQEDGTLRLTLSGPLWKLERTQLESFEPFGMTPREGLYWMGETGPAATRYISTRPRHKHLSQTLLLCHSPSRIRLPRQQSHTRKRYLDHLQEKRQRIRFCT